MDRYSEPVTVDAETYIGLLRTQLTEAWGNSQAELVLAKAENAQLRTLLAKRDQQIADLNAEKPAAGSTRP
ncbi:hypothetical protein LN042_18945 [Kitasatospora sp. RB6PN24]|uniref:hypothetical protein n=1 Tax=Kitasatospora humi TaxID=2893891 RepID=UPI001E3452B9|nr:hypothetical protein [Kitasatospora humi]MCC9309134.1 hypothetical protein [Kitasatospora humi]